MTLDIDKMEAAAKAATLIDTEHSGYFVNRLGEVWSTHQWRGMNLRKLSPQPNTYGYLTVKVKTDNGSKKAFVHKLVCIAFNGEKPFDHYQIRHLDGDKTNNKPENLAWGTISENALDRQLHGTCMAAKNGASSHEKSTEKFNELVKSGKVNFAVGSRSPQSKFSEAEVLEIRELSKIKSNREIAKQFCVASTTIDRIVNRDSWRHI